VSQKFTHNAEINGMTVAHAAGQLPIGASQFTANYGGISAFHPSVSGMIPGYERIEEGREREFKSDYTAGFGWKQSERSEAAGSKNSRWVDQNTKVNQITFSDALLSLVSKLPEESISAPNHS
jgi:hypothetical protein